MLISPSVIPRLMKESMFSRFQFIPKTYRLNRIRFGSADSFFALHNVNSDLVGIPSLFIRCLSFSFNLFPISLNHLLFNFRGKFGGFNHSWNRPRFRSHSRSSNRLYGTVAIKKIIQEIVESFLFFQFSILPLSPTYWII